MTKKIGNAFASPTKQFFVNMLTRDIELEDAILDLLDNCVDGILRSGGVKKGGKPYRGFEATITMAPDYFQIEDNCGGIPFAIAEKYAFAMGRPKGATAVEAAASVGMYGIGMKRAIFKMGTDAIVESRNDKGFVVEFKPEWMQTDEWKDLPMHQLEDERLPEKGTRILIDELRPETAAAFSDQNWIGNFKKIASRQYSLIIAKGFKVKIGSPADIKKADAVIVPSEFSLLTTEFPKSGEPAIAPYVYRGEVKGVDVEIYAGLYRELLSEDELDSEEQTRGTSDDAGWTIACNDRVVIWKDKTRMTGWGEAPVPHFHGQFIAITGIVLLRSDDPKRLPLTTTKRGVDAGSDIYLEVKELMREATKALTSFTNKWKKWPNKLDKLYLETKYMDLPEIRAWAASIPVKKIRNLEGMRKFEPDYPEPDEPKVNVRVSFVATIKDVALLRSHYFEDEKVKPGVVGEKAFSETVKSVRRRR